MSYQPVGSYRSDGNLERRGVVIGLQQRKLSRQKIVDAAFSAWGCTHFTRTSLSRVADALSVTKPAVYRYFRSKEDLLHAMEKDFAERFARYVVQPLREARHVPGGSERSGPDGAYALARRYFEAVFTFYEDNPFHYLFFLRRLLGRIERSDHSVRLRLRERDALLLDGLDELAPRADGETQILVCRYVSLSAAYWSTQHYRSSIGRTAHSECDFSPEALKPAVDQRERLLEAYAVHLASGFLRDRWSGNFERVERIAWIQPEELPEVDRIFHSISEVVLDVGYGAATVERIAQHIGLSKSGLYHYFGNKNEMLSQSLIRVQRHIAGLAQHRFRQLETDPERLYAVFVIAASYAFHEPSITITENWLRESNVEVRIPPSHTTELRTIYSFVSDMLSGGRLVGREEDGFAVLSFIFFLANQEVSRLAGGPGYAQRITGLTRNLFRLFTAGVRASLQSNTRNEVHQ